MKHTPEPWGVESDGVTIYMGGQIVATAIAPDEATIEEQRANATLIACAPSLLEALETIALLPTVGGITAGERKGLERAARAARAAIAKATGADK